MHVCMFCITNWHDSRSQLGEDLVQHDVGTGWVSAISVELLCPVRVGVAHADAACTVAWQILALPS